jgi:hypothetical protein
MKADGLRKDGYWHNILGVVPSAENGKSLVHIFNIQIIKIYHKLLGLIKTSTSAHGTFCYLDQAEALQLDALKRFLRKSDSKWHFLYFFPLPHQHSSFRPSLGISFG